MKRCWRWGRAVTAGFLGNNCAIHAAGLTYFAMLSVVPILCCILVAAKACRVSHYAKAQINAQIDAMIAKVEKAPAESMALLAPRDEEARRKKQIAAEEFAVQARRLSNTVFERVERFDVGTLGWVGFGFLLWTVISSLGMVETSFNIIWGVAKPRPIWKRACMYLFIMIVLPVMATVAMSLPVLNAAKNVIVATLGATSLTHWMSDGLVWLLDSWVFRTAFTLTAASLSFAFFFWAMPNCRVAVRPALYGGAITAVLFGAWMKACAVAQVGIARSSALYGSFAFLPILLAWLYMSWQIVLLGANMVHCLEEPKP